MKENFEDRLKILAMLSGCDSTLDDFEKGYCALLAEVRGRLAQARTVEAVGCCADHRGWVKSLAVVGE